MKFGRPLIWILCIAALGVSCSRLKKSPTGLAIGLGANEADLAPAGGIQKTAENPIAPAARPKTSGGPLSVPNIYGTTSVQIFNYQMPNLTYTHASADGFRKYLAKWYAPNFVFRDSSVGVWAFHDTAKLNYDDWDQDGVRRGIDAVLACWHSSHGGTHAGGIYETWMGSDWSGKGWTAVSNRMALGGDYNGSGNETLRYMFWDTCQAIRVENGYSPKQTWSPRAKGIRMMFGYETASIDRPTYGQFFWEEWCKNKPLSTAFLDASWRIYHDQIPVALAFGATAAEAETRRDTERLLYSEPAGSKYAAWRWYSSVDGPGSSGRKAALSAPSQVSTYDVAFRSNSDAEFTNIAQNMGIAVSDPEMVESRAFGLRVVRTKGLTLVVDPNGDFELSLNLKARKSMAAGGTEDGELVDRAKSLIAEFDLAGGTDVQYSAMRYTHVNTGAEGSSDGTPRTVEKTIVFDQMIDGLPFIDADAGHLEITFDAATGQALHFRSSLRPLRDKSQARQRATQAAISIDAARRAALGSVVESPVPGGQSIDAAYEIIPHGEDVGYVVADGKATVVYRARISSSRYPEMRPIEVEIPLANLQ